MEAQMNSPTSRNDDVSKLRAIATAIRLDGRIASSDDLRAIADRLAAESETSPTLLEVCEALFGCHVSPGRDEYGETEYRCAECEEKLDITKWVTAEHSASCLINRVRKYLAVHKPQCVPGVKP
jgi:hypothetical protein